MIKFNNIRKSFGDRLVIKNFSLDIKDGEFIAIMGPSGSGKTTLLRIAAGLENADSGEISGIPERKAFVFQEDRLAEDYSVESNMKMASRKKIPEAEIETHLEELGLAGEIKTKVRKLSGGMKRRVAIARAILADADVIFLDEPFKGLDNELKKNVMDYVKKYSAGKTVLMVTHDRTEADYMTKHIISLSLN